MAHVATKPDRHAAYEAAQQRVSADYRAKTPGSAALFERAREALPGGVSGNLRYFPPYPLYIERGDGCRMVDVDGNDYSTVSSVTARRCSVTITRPSLLPSKQFAIRVRCRSIRR